MVDHNCQDGESRRTTGSNTCSEWMSCELQRYPAYKIERRFEDRRRGASRIEFGLRSMLPQQTGVCHYAQHASNKCPTIPLVIVTLAQYGMLGISNLGLLLFVKITLYPSCRQPEAAALGLANRWLECLIRRCAVPALVLCHQRTSVIPPRTFMHDLRPSKMMEILGSTSPRRSSSPVDDFLCEYLPCTGSYCPVNAPSRLSFTPAP
jgi:hypothetical protein